MHSTYTIIRLCDIQTPQAVYKPCTQVAASSEEVTTANL